MENTVLRSINAKTRKAPQTILFSSIVLGEDKNGDGGIMKIRYFYRLY